MLVSKLDVDDVVSWFSGAVGDLAGAVLQVLCVDVHFAGTLNGQTQATIACDHSTQAQRLKLPAEAFNA